MDYEKKLALAKEALDSGSYDKETIEYIFPELKKSDDERIRKALIDGFTVMKESKNCGKTFSNHNIPVVDILAWLEKQGEKTIPKNIDDAALQYVDTCTVDGEVTHNNIIEPYWNYRSMINAYKAGWIEKQRNESVRSVGRKN